MILKREEPRSVMAKKIQIIKTAMMKRYIIKFLIRLAIFVAVFVAYITHKEILYRFMTYDVSFGLSKYGVMPLHLLWLLFFRDPYYHKKASSVFHRLLYRLKYFELGFCFR